MPDSSWNTLLHLLAHDPAAAHLLDALTAPPPVDLRTLLAEMAALRQEVRAETQATRQLREAVEAHSPTTTPPPPPAPTTPPRLDLERAQEDARRAQGRALVETLDRLALSLPSAERLATPRRRWFKKEADPDALALLDALRLLNRHLRERLLDLGFETMNVAPGDRFDPERMEALGVVEQSDAPADVVTEVVAQGYHTPGQRALRLAQVIVNRSGRAALQDKSS